MSTVAIPVAQEHSTKSVRAPRVLAAVAAFVAFAVTGSAWATQAHADPIQAQPVASPMEDSAAISAFAGEFGAATAVGGFGGTVAGAVIGCAVGGIVTAPTLVFVPAGCLAGAVTGAGIGGVVGTIVVGGPALALAGSDLVGTLAAPADTTKWAQR